MIRPLAAILAFCLIGTGFAQAAEPLGTAGRFRTVAFANCGVPFIQLSQGACDPAPVPDGLPVAERAAAHLKRAVALVSLGRLEQAKQAINDALRADPRHVEALVFRVRLTSTLMMPGEVERDLNAALLVAPDNPYLLATRAEYVLDSGNAKAALRDVAEASRRQPDDADILWIKARVLMALDRLDQAKPHLDRALELEPDEPRVRLFRAQLHLRRGALEQAVADANTLLASRPADVSALELRALIHTALGRIEDAVADLNGILGPPGNITFTSPAVAHFNQLIVQRAILLAKLDRVADANRDLHAIVAHGGRRAVIRLQVFLRRNGFEELPLDGKRTAAFDQALEACIINQACGRGLVRSL